MQHVAQLIKQRIVAARYYQSMLNIAFSPQQAYSHRFSCLAAFLALRYIQYTVRFHERRHNAAPPVKRGGNQLIPHLSQPYPHEFPVFQPGYHGARKHCADILLPISSMIIPFEYQGL